MEYGSRYLCNSYVSRKCENDHAGSGLAVFLRWSHLQSFNPVRLNLLEAIFWCRTIKRRYVARMRFPCFLQLINSDLVKHTLHNLKSEDSGEMLRIFADSQRCVCERGWKQTWVKRILQAHHSFLPLFLIQVDQGQVLVAEFNGILIKIMWINL